MDEGAIPNGSIPDEPSQPLWLSPTVIATTALREPRTAVAARQQARKDAGLDPNGLDYPRARLWLIAVLPAAVIAALCLIVLLVGGPVIWGIAGAAAAVVAGGSVGYLRRDPLRMASDERREIVSDRSWHSRQPWTGELTQTPERRIVGQAQEAVTLLVGAPAWSSRAFDEHRLRLDLKAELDEIDRQAFQLASGHPGDVTAPPEQAPRAKVHRAERGALQRRVDALTAYARAVAALAPDPPPLPSPASDDRVQHALTATVRDEFATEQWTAMRRELSVDRPAEPA